MNSNKLQIARVLRDILSLRGFCFMLQQMRKIFREIFLRGFNIRGFSLQRHGIFWYIFSRFCLKGIFLGVFLEERGGIVGDSSTRGFVADVNLKSSSLAAPPSERGTVMNQHTSLETPTEAMSPVFRHTWTTHGERNGSIFFQIFPLCCKICAFYAI